MRDSDSKNVAVNNSLPLLGLDGSNPVGFLAALGVFQTLSSSCRIGQLRMSWEDETGRWIPALHGPLQSVAEVAAILAKQLKCPFSADPAAEKRREQLQKAFDAKKTELKRARDALKKKRLRGKEREQENARTVAPIEAELVDCRRQWLTTLRSCVPSTEMAIGKHLNAKLDEFRETLKDAIAESSKETRAVVDLLASFGSDVCGTRQGDQMEPTPFCFVTGSGHQYFLDTARQLTECVDVSRLETSLATLQEPADEKLSMRWDPTEDRRYALMWEDPTASGNKSLTNWATNLLAYHGLQMIPTVPARKGLETVGWSTADGLTWRWPIWRAPATVDVVRSLLSCVPTNNHRQELSDLSSLGVVAVYQTTRIQVGNPPLHKVNFAPAEQIA
ncbi:MAG: hypothetical protein KDA99_28795 [Planctomycetales bacterium]|nr:hypothetical protein [Planctomycetales bacterium]